MWCHPSKYMYVCMYVLMSGLCLCLDVWSLSGKHLYCLCKWHTPTPLMKTLITIPPSSSPSSTLIVCTSAFHHLMKIIITIIIIEPFKKYTKIAFASGTHIWWKLSQSSSLLTIFWLTLLEWHFCSPHKMFFSQVVLIWVESADSTNLVTNLQIKEKF